MRRHNLNLMGPVACAMLAWLGAFPAPAAASPLPPLLWSRTFNGPSSGTDLTRGAALDAGGNFFVAGHELSGAIDQWVVRKFSPAGATLWEDRYAGATGGGADAISAAVDATGDLVVGGFETVAGQDKNWVIRKYAGATGVVLWSRSYNSPANNEDIVWNVAVDPAGDVLVAGHELRLDLGQGINWLARKYQGATGTVVWSVTYTSAGALNESAYGVAADAAGNVVIAGYTMVSASVGVWRIVKCDSNGNVLWTRTENGSPSNVDARPYRVVIDASGNITVGGSYLPTVFPNNDWLTVKYDASGNKLWLRTWSGSGGSTDLTNAAGLMADGTILVGGFDTIGGQGRNWLVRALDASGTLQWTLTYNGAASGDDEIKDVAANPAGDVWVAGTESVSGQGINWVVRRYAYPVAFAVTLSQTPASPAVGAPVTYRIDVTNLSATLITSLAVVDTIPAVVTGLASDQPAAFGGPVVTATGGGPRYEWAASGLALAPGQTFTFTVSGNVSQPCAPINSPDQAVATASASAGTLAKLSNTTTLTLSPPTTALTAVVAQAPASPAMGNPVAYRLVVTNTGTATVTALTVTDTVSPVVTGAVTDQPAGFPAAVQTSVPGAGTRFEWSAGGLAMAPGTSFTFTITGTVGTTCAATNVSDRAVATGVTACAAASPTSNTVSFATAGQGVSVGAVLRASPSSRTGGGPVTYTFVVTNTGVATLLGLTVSDTLPAGVAFVSQTNSAGLAWNGSSSAPAWSGPVTLGPGASVTVVVDATIAASYAGVVTNTGWVLASNLLCGPVQASAAASVTVTPPDPLTSGKVKIVGGVRGYLDAKRGEQATILVRPDAAGRITVRIYTLRGALVRKFEVDTTGGHTEVIRWDATDAAGAPVPPGAYPTVIEAPGIRFEDTLAVLR